MILKAIAFGGKYFSSFFHAFDFLIITVSTVPLQAAPVHFSHLFPAAKFANFLTHFCQLFFAKFGSSTAVSAPIFASNIISVALAGSVAQSLELERLSDSVSRTVLLSSLDGRYSQAHHADGAWFGT